MREEFEDNENFFAVSKENDLEEYEGRPELKWCACAAREAIRKERGFEVASQASYTIL